MYVGEGSERERCHLLGSCPTLSHFPRYPQANWALLVLIALLGTSHGLSCETESFSTAITCTDFYSQMFWDFISLCWKPGLYHLSHSPVVPPGLSTHKCGTTCSTSHCLPSSSSTALQHPSPSSATLLWVLSDSVLAACLCPSYQSGWMFLL